MNIPGEITTSIGFLTGDARELTTAERFLVLPLFVAAGVVLVFVGGHAIRRRTIRAKWSSRLLFGTREWTGGMAVFQGAVLCGIGALLAVAAVMMIVLGRHLLP